MILKTDAFIVDVILLKDAWSICDFVVANEDRIKRYFQKRSLKI